MTYWDLGFGCHGAHWFLAGFSYIHSASSECDQLPSMSFLSFPPPVVLVYLGRGQAVWLINLISLGKQAAHTVPWFMVSQGFVQF